LNTRRRQTTLNRSLDLLARLLGGQVKLIAVLQVHPKSSLNAKPLFQAQGGVGCHGPFATMDRAFVEPLKADASLLIDAAAEVPLAVSA
jgi:hypothetical protein